MSETGKTPSLLAKAIPQFVLNKNKFKIITPNATNTDLINRLKSLAQPRILFRDIVIYESTEGDFLKLVGQKLTIVNRTYVTTSISQTVARYESAGKVVLEKTSDDVQKLIGKDNYDLLFSTLCSVISQEFKVRAILALLTVPTKLAQTESQTMNKCDSVSNSVTFKKTETGSQTDETCIADLMKRKPRKRIKRPLPSPYVVTTSTSVNRVVINPSDFSRFSAYAEESEMHTAIKTEKLKCEENLDFDVTDEPNTDLPILHLEEDSKDSIGNLSMSSYLIPPEILQAPMSLLNTIQQVTAPEQPKEPIVDWGSAIPLTLLDGTVVKIPVKPEDDFHIATPEIMKYVPPEHRRKLLWYQAYIDWKYCLRRDEDSFLPIHTAVINQDLDLLRRHCLVLKTRNESVDVLTEDNMSALHMSIFAGASKCTTMLLHFGADPLLGDDEYRNCFHLAAEASNDCLKPLITYCQANPLKVLQENGEFWKPELATKPKEYQTSYLLNAICTTPENQGYTPLMLASKVGNYENVKLLIEAAPGSVNTQTPACGNTALYQAVAGACYDSDARGNRSKLSENFKKTIELLVENGADPSIANNSGADINSLITEFAHSELSMLLAQKFTSINCKNLDSQHSEPLILYRKQDGTLNTLGINDQRKLKNLNATNNIENKYKPFNVPSTTNNEVNKIMNIATNVNLVNNNSSTVDKPPNIETNVNINDNNAIVESKLKGIIKNNMHDKNLIQSYKSGNYTVTMVDYQVNKDLANKTNNETEKKALQSENLIVLENKLLKQVLNKNQESNDSKDVKSQNHFINSYKNFVDSFKNIEEPTYLPLEIATTSKRSGMPIVQVNEPTIQHNATVKTSAKRKSTMKYDGRKIKVIRKEDNKNTDDKKKIQNSLIKTESIVQRGTGGNLIKIVNSSNINKKTPSPTKNSEINAKTEK